jgi:transcriptional regulator with XRE-family HTH domain
VKTLGDHLRTQRLKRGLLQKEVAALFGVNVNTVVGWEIGRREPKVSYLPAIISFLGYDPTEEGQSLGERLQKKRRRQGLTQVKLARQLGILQAVVSILETGGEVTNARVLAAVRAFLDEGG